MVEPSLDLQRAIMNALETSPAVIALVPVENIMDRHGLPDADRMIIIGTGMVINADYFDTFYDRASLDLHVFTREPGLEICKTIADAVRRALPAAPWRLAEHMVYGMSVSMRFMRDKEPEIAHGVVSIDATMKAAA